MIDSRQLGLAMRIRLARVGVDLDQRQLAEALGVSRQTISHWERGGAQPALGHAARLAKVTGVTLEWLAEGVETEKTPTSDGEGLAVRPKGFEPLTFWSVVAAIPDTVPVEWTAGTVVP